MDLADVNAAALSFWQTAHEGQAGFILRYAGYSIVFIAWALALRAAPRSIRTWGLAAGSLAIFALLTNVALATIFVLYLVVFYAAVEKLPQGHARTAILTGLVSLHFVGPIFWLPLLPGYEGRVREYVSFATNLTMLRFWGYAYDRSRRAEPGTPAFVDFALYMLFFPAFVNGPIVTHVEFEERKLGWYWNDMERRGLFASLWEERSSLRRALVGIALGVAVMAIALPYRDQMYRRALGSNAFGWPNAMYTYLWWYFSFTAWTEAAIGISRLAGIHLPENFDAPHNSYGIADFWRRWNITFMVWLRRFIFLPLGGALIRGRDGQRHLEWRNTCAVFLAVGVYHLLGGVKLLGPVWYPWTSVVPWIVWAGMNAAGVLATRHMKRPKQLGARGMLIVASTLLFAAAGHMTAMFPPQAKLQGLARLWSGLVWPFGS